MRLPATLDLHDWPSPEIAHPVGVTTVEPRVGAVIYDPESGLEPATVGVLGAQDDDLAAELNQRPVSHHVGNAETECRG
jgi:hypothetical protein